MLLKWRIPHKKNWKPLTDSRVCLEISYVHKCDTTGLIPSSIIVDLPLPFPVKKYL